MWSRLPLIGPLVGRLDRSVAAKIILAFAVVVMVGIGVVAFLANDRTTAAFEHYLRGTGPDVQGQLVTVAATVYAQAGSWVAVGQVFTAMPGPPDQRTIVTDSSGAVVVDTESIRTGKPSTTPSLSNGRPIILKGATIGTLYRVLPIGDAGGSGAAQAGSPPPGLSRSDRDFLDQVNQSLIVAAVAAILAALVLGSLLARQIIRPLRQLTRVAQRIAHGHLDERIDVTGRDEVAQLGEAFNHMAESLQRTENARRQLVADIAHELRTPLMVVNGTVEAIQDGVLLPDKANLATIREEVASLSRLVSDLRELSLGDVGQIPMEHEAVDVGDVLDSVGSAFASAAASHQLRFSVDLSPDLPWILGDGARLRQCVRNLVENAMRYTPSGGQVTLRGRAVGDTVTIEVIDTGEGIKAEDLPHVFERFFRADRSRSRRSGGSGLGLAIVQQIVRALGGDVSVASDGHGLGTTVTIRLPALRPSELGNLATSRS